MKLIGTKTLKTKRLLLRKFNMNDLEDFYDYASNDQITKYLTWNPHQSKEESQKILENIFTKYDNKTFRWAIILKKENKLIGSIDVVNLNIVDELVEIGYALNVNYHNNGFMTEAFKEVINYLFNEVNVKEIRACFQIDNTASFKVMQKCGFKDLNLIVEKILPLKNNKVVYVKYMSLKNLKNNLINNSFNFI